jgi:uroporphyrinogen-III synthase
MNDSLKALNTFKVWMPRIHVAEGGSALSHALEKEGIEVLEQAWQRLKNLNHLELAPDFSASWWVFTSAIAVKAWADYLEDSPQTHRIHTVQIACVGQATADAVESHFKRSADFVPKAAQDATYFAESFNQQYTNPTSCLWVCSALADETIIQLLKAGGHNVQALPLYKPVALEASALDRFIEDAVAFSPDVVLLTSPSNVAVLASLGAFDRVCPKEWICLGRRSFEAVKHLGVNIPLKMLEHPTAEALLDACAELRYS